MSWLSQSRPWSRTGLFRVDGPQDGYRVPVWDARENRTVYIGVEAIGPVGAPTWADFSDDGRWVHVNLSVQQHLVAMQGDCRSSRIW